MNFIKMTLGNVKTSYKNAMSETDLEKFMLSGVVLQGLEGQVLHLIDETPISLVTSTVKQVAAKKKVTLKLIWKNLASPRTHSGATLVKLPQLPLRDLHKFAHLFSDR